MKKLYMVCGCAGSGKSTWIKNHNDGICISRDTIRFSMVAEDEPYFSQEQKVFRKYVNSIKYALINNDCVFADATHLSPKARKEVLKRLNLDGVEVIAVGFTIPLAMLIERNARRKGRENVPVEVITGMYNRYVLPSYEEGYFDKIIIVDENNFEKVLDKSEVV